MHSNAMPSESNGRVTGDGPFRVDQFPVGHAEAAEAQADGIPEATVARLQDGEVLTTDGPYVEGKEHVGGLSIIKAPELDTAIEWGRKLARAVTIPVEVREFQGDPTDHMD